MVANPPDESLFNLEAGAPRRQAIPLPQTKRPGAGIARAGPLVSIK